MYHIHVPGMYVSVLYQLLDLDLDLVLCVDGGWLGATWDSVLKVLYSVRCVRGYPIKFAPE